MKILKIDKRRKTMKAEITMKIKCCECGKKISIQDERTDEYNIFWIGTQPVIICPECMKKEGVNNEKSETV